LCFWVYANCFVVLFGNPEELKEIDDYYATIFVWAVSDICLRATWATVQIM